MGLIQGESDASAAWPQIRFSYAEGGGDAGQEEEQNPTHGGVGCMYGSCFQYVCVPDVLRS